MRVQMVTNNVGLQAKQDLQNHWWFDLGQPALGGTFGGVMRQDVGAYAQRVHSLQRQLPPNGGACVSMVTHFIDCMMMCSDKRICRSCEYTDLISVSIWNAANNLSSVVSPGFPMSSHRWVKNASCFTTAKWMRLYTRWVMRYVRSKLSSVNTGVSVSSRQKKSLSSSCDPEVSVGSTGRG